MGALLDLIDFPKLRRAVLYLLVLAGAFLLQNLVGSRVLLFGVKALYMPALVVAIGFFQGGVWGAVIGLAAGYFCDLGFSENTVLFLLLFPAVGYFSGVVGKYYFHKAYGGYLVLAVAALLLTGGCQMFRAWFFNGAALPAVLRVELLQTLRTLPFTIPAFFVCRLIAGRDID